MYTFLLEKGYEMDKERETKTTQLMMTVGAVLCIAAAVLSFFIGSFEGILHIAVVALLLVCTFGGILLVGLGIRSEKKKSP